MDMSPISTSELDHEINQFAIDVFDLLDKLIVVVRSFATSYTLEMMMRSIQPCYGESRRHLGAFVSRAIHDCVLFRLCLDFLFQ